MSSFYGLINYNLGLFVWACATMFYWSMTLWKKKVNEVKPEVIYLRQLVFFFFFFVFCYYFFWLVKGAFIIKLKYKAKVCLMLFITWSNFSLDFSWIDCNVDLSWIDREQSIFECMIQNLFEEYRFFPRYPEKQLKIAAGLFGMIYFVICSVLLCWYGWWFL